MRRNAGVLLASSMLVGSFSLSGEAIPEYVPVVRDAPNVSIQQAVVSPETRTFVETTYGQLAQYWRGRAAARLVLLSGGEVRFCGDTTHLGTVMATAMDSSPSYCAPSNEIQVPAWFVIDTAPRISDGDAAIAQAGMRLAMAHEYGHDLEETMYGQQGYENLAGNAATSKQLENYADAIAGQSICDIWGADEVGRAAIFMAHVPEDTEHSNDEQRIAEFRRGAAYAGC
jgi:hypothetical protein